MINTKKIISKCLGRNNENNIQVRKLSPRERNMYTKGQNVAYEVSNGDVRASVKAKDVEEYKEKLKGSYIDPVTFQPKLRQGVKTKWER